ncbi:MAG: translocation/assembly module TamB domain-containing protein [Candidatus Marinimicrobia bacterium]|nr:translocation/assembly module TamB domain-containing protein [Candidatus Neomarinimicrobiota bacterium]
MAISKIKNYKLVKIIFGILITGFLIIFITFLLNPFIFIQDLENKITSVVQSKSGMILDYSNFSGNFFTGFKLDSPILIHKKKKICKLDNLIIHPGILTSILSNYLSLNKLVLNNGFINFDLLFNNSSEHISKNLFQINLLELNEINIINNNLSYQVNAKVNISIGNEKNLKIYSCICKMNEWPYEFELSNGEINSIDNKFIVEDLEISSKSGTVEITGEFDNQEIFKSFANINIYKLNLNELLNYPVELENINIMVERINSDSTIAIINGKLITDKIIFNNINANIGLVNQFIYLNKSNFKFLNSEIKINGWYDVLNEKINLSSNLLNVELPNKYKNNINGNIELLGSIYSDSIIVNLALENTKINNFHFTNLNGEFLYENQHIINIEKIEGNSDNIEFKLDDVAYSIDDEFFKTNGSLKLSNFDKNYNLFNENINYTINGEFIGELELSSDYINLNGEINLLNSIINENEIGSIETGINFTKNNLLNSQNFSLNGNALNINLKSIKYFKLDSLSYSINIEDEKVKIDYLNGYNGLENILFLKDINIKHNEITSNKFFINYNDVEISTLNLRGEKQNNEWVFENLPLSFNNEDILLNSSFSSFENFKMKVNSNKVNLSTINSLLGYSQRIQGNAKGEFLLNKLNSSYKVNINSLLLNGQIDEIMYDSLFVAIDANENKINYNEIKLVYENQNLLFSGEHFPNKNSENIYRSGEININGNAQNFNLLNVNNYIPISFNIDGELTGNFNISGTPESPEIIFNSKIQNPKFDLIKGEQITGEIYYKNEITRLENVILKTLNGTYRVKGDIPLNLNIFGRKSYFYNIPKLDISIIGETTEFEFLSPYFEIVDSLTGHISLNLEITGSLQKPIRNGQININHAKLNLMPLENIIYGINGKANIINNKLNFIFLNGITGKIQKQNLLTNITNFIKSSIGLKSEDELASLSVIGKMDLTEFFNPEFDLLIKSDNLYISSIENSFRGNASAKFEITGKDTIYIDGKFNPSPNKFTFLMEFSEDETLTKESIKNGKIISYNIHIPLENGVKIENSQMDGLIDGDIVLTSIGNEPFTFSGNINVVDGSFYFNGNTIDQISGNISLDPTAIEPIIDFNGITNVAGKDIEISLSGNMDNPNLSLESISDPDLTQNDLLYLMVFTPDSIGNSGDFIGTEQVGNLITNYVENTLERNIVRNSVLDKFQFNTQGGTLLTGFENSHLNLYLGKNIGPNLYLNLRSDLNSENSTFQYEVGYRLSRNMSIIGRIDENQLYHLTYRFKYKY